MGYLCFTFFSHLPASNALFLLTKQSINGIANALIARLIFSGYVIWTETRKISIHELLSNLLVLFVLLPSLALLTVGGKNDLAEVDRQVRVSLIRTACRSLKVFRNG